MTVTDGQTDTRLILLSFRLQFLSAEPKKIIKQEILRQHYILLKRYIDSILFFRINI